MRRGWCTVGVAAEAVGAWKIAGVGKLARPFDAVPLRYRSRCLAWAIVGGTGIGHVFGKFVGGEDEIGAGVRAEILQSAHDGLVVVSRFSAAPSGGVRQARGRRKRIHQHRDPATVKDGAGGRGPS